MVQFANNAFAHGSKPARAVSVLALFLAIFLFAGSVWAEDGDGGDDDIPEGPLGEQLEDYWSVDRDVDVIKERLYERGGRFGVGIFSGLMPSEPFYWYLPTGLRLNYYFNNNWGIEVEGSYMGVDGVFQHPTDLGDFVEGRKADYDRNTDALDQFTFQAHALAVWHPLYGKLSVLQRKLAHFDVNLAAGLGAFGVTRPNETRTNSRDIVTPSVVYGGGVQFFINNNFVVRVDGRGYIYRGPRRWMNTDGTNERVVSEPRESANARELNFIEELEFPAQFLAGVTYMF